MCLFEGLCEGLFDRRIGVYCSCLYCSIPWILAPGAGAGGIALFASCRLLAAGATVTVVRDRPKKNGCMWAKVCRAKVCRGRGCLLRSVTCRAKHLMSYRQSRKRGCPRKATGRQPVCAPEVNECR